MYHFQHNPSNIVHSWWFRSKTKGVLRDRQESKLAVIVQVPDERSEMDAWGLVEDLLLGSNRERFRCKPLDRIETLAWDEAERLRK